MAERFAALLRFWDVLQGPRYAYRVPDTHHTLDELIAYIYRETLEAWCPGGPASVREHRRWRWSAWRAPPGRSARRPCSG
ncbi:hypothetical protein ACN28S_56400 [Cystobacter fuscus]